MAGIDNGVAVPEDGHPGWDHLGSLLTAVARGDEGAFELVYEQLFGPVYGVILAVLRDPAQAEEVAQEVFLEMWLLAVRYDPGKGSATGWALTIARHRAIDRVRAASASSARELRAATDLPPAQASDTVADAADRQLLRQGLASLTHLQRQAITLAFYGEHTYAEVARILGVPLGTIKARIRDGLARLRHGMHDGAAGREQEAAASQLQGTLHSRVLIDQVSGILAERLQVTPDEALALLRRYARNHNHTLAQLARGIAAGPPQPPAAARPQPHRAAEDSQSADPGRGSQPP